LKPPTQPSIQRVTGADNSGGKESEEQSWPLTSIWRLGQEW
jgi:hypothetical protein